MDINALFGNLYMGLFRRAKKSIKRKWGFQEPGPHSIDRPVPSKEEVTRALEHFQNRTRVPGSSETDPRRIEELNRSHGLEWFSRAVVLPAAYSAWGSNVKAAVIRGSVQKGVRKATTRKREVGPSDLDIELIIDRMPVKGRADLKQFRDALKKAHSKKEHGFKLNYQISTPDNFKLADPLNPHPFHVIHGTGFLNRLMGEDYMEERKDRAVPYKSKYVQD